MVHCPLGSINTNKYRSLFRFRLVKAIERKGESTSEILALSRNCEEDALEDLCSQNARR